MNIFHFNNDIQIQSIVSDSTPYEQRSREELILIAFYENTGRDFSTQSEIAEAISNLTGGQIRYSQSNITKGLTALNTKNLFTPSGPIKIYKHHDYYCIMDLNDYWELEISYLHTYHPFKNHSIFYNNPDGASTVFGFKVKQNFLDRVCDHLSAIIGPSNIFDIFIQNDNLIVLLDPNSILFHECSDMLRDFFENN